jgi:hypothetical protein
MNNNLPAVQSNFPSQIELQSVALIARTAHASGLYGGVGGEAKIMMILLAAKELGVGPCQALNGGIWSIQGKVEISARLMNGLIRRAGHSIKVVMSDDTCCTLLGTRSDGDFFETSFTMDDAVKAGLANGNVWKKYPADMLYNRCMSRLARRLFSDVISECYVEGEISESKEAEKKEKNKPENLEQAECEEITQKPSKFIESLKTLNQEIKDAPNLGHFRSETDLTQEHKISSEQLDMLMIAYAPTTQDFKENMEKYIANEWGVKELEHLPAIHFQKIMNWIAKNMEMQKMAVNNA